VFRCFNYDYIDVANSADDGGDDGCDDHAVTANVLDLNVIYPMIICSFLHLADTTTAMTMQPKMHPA